MRIIKRIIYKKDDETIESWETRVNEFFQDLQKISIKQSDLLTLSTGDDNKRQFATYAYWTESEEKPNKIGF